MHRESKHLQVGNLEAAVQAMAESLREGQDIRIIKVKSHIGIKGNEEADRLAHDACVEMNCHQQVLEACLSGNTYIGQFKHNLELAVALQDRCGHAQSHRDPPLNCLLEAHLPRVRRTILCRISRSMTSERE